MRQPVRTGDTNIVLSDANTVVFSRLPRELNIVSLAPRGGFFPAEVNGAIR
ncbi:hypothetical protein DEDE109153_15375 [Deinococcus deserti]|uniref:hypothetical protein n=1 Tax=Deinococcus deserti TaxID=310783 RepID=UPI0018778791|nr:hypothetical protein [Deinococcus deserti]